MTYYTIGVLADLFSGFDAFKFQLLNTSMYNTVLFKSTVVVFSAWIYTRLDLFG